jgi:peptidoglycan/LPS O-acetylase OafA/YrhL
VKQKNTLIQYLRGIAILNVIGYHFFARWTEPIHFENLYPWGGELANIIPFKYGYLGVQLFFVISGFVISTTLINSESFLIFWKKRFIRLFPSLLIIMPLLFFTQKYFGIKPDDYGSRNPFSIVTSVLLIHPNLTEAITPSHSEIGWTTGVLWSLWCEIHFYLLISFIYFNGRKENFIKLFVISAFVLSLFGIFDITSIKLFDSNPILDALLVLRQYIVWFGIGVIFSAAHQARSYNGLRLLLLIFTSAAIFIENLRAGTIPFYENIYITLFCLLTFMFFYFISSERHCAVPIQKPISAIGNASYELYLWHESLFLTSIVVYMTFIPSTKFQWFLLITLVILLFFTFLMTYKSVKLLSSLFKRILSID